jgi:hypothetical protein
VTPAVGPCEMNCIRRPGSACGVTDGSGKRFRCAGIGHLAGDVLGDELVDRRHWERDDRQPRLGRFHETEAEGLRKGGMDQEVRLSEQCLDSEA